MTLIKRNENRFPTFDYLLNDLFNEGISKEHAFGGSLPAVNIKETEDSYAIELAAPGYKKGDFNLELNQDVLTISSERKEEKEDKKEGNYTRREFGYYSFRRSFTLPDSVDSEKIEAKYNDGVLNLFIPKKEEAKVKPIRQIEVK